MKASVEQVQAKTGREGARRVKTGCHTCKRRKVKCDESWPVCLKCKNTGRSCDGYGIWGGGTAATKLDGGSLETNKSSSLQLEPYSSATSSTMTEPLRVRAFGTEEAQCFDWFVGRSASKLPGVFPSNLFISLMYQASMTEPAIRHAMLALGSAHKEEVSGANTLKRNLTNDDDRQAIFTITQYNKSIRNLQAHFNDDSHVSQHVTLLTCSLFMWTEFLRGHYASGVLHMESGIRLLQKTFDGDLMSGSPTWMQIDGWLITNFTRFFVQAKLFGQSSLSARAPFWNLDLEPRYTEFRSIHHARRELEHMMLNSFVIQERFLETESEVPSVVDLDLSKRQAQLKDALQIWYKINQKTLAQTHSPMSWLERFAYRLLRLYYYLACIVVGTCLDPLNELAYDRHESDFLKIMSHCVETVALVYPGGQRNPRGHHDPEPTSPNSVSDIGWIAPLYFTAIKCRNHHMRRLAIRLLKVSEHKEGIWNSPLVVAIAEEVTNIEEGSCHANTDNQGPAMDLAIPTEEELAQPMLPLSQRLTCLKVLLPSNRFENMSFRASRVLSDGVVEQITRIYDLRTRKWIV